MAWKHTEIPYQDTGFFSKIITNYLASRPELRSFYTHAVDKEGIRAAIQAREAYPTDRGLLVSVLNEQYERVAARPETARAIASLADPGTFVVTTAHQPAIFTGTLYFVYKILHAIRLADWLCQEFPGKHFVPVFYMGCEDADLDELGHIWLGGEKLAWDTKQTGAVGRMHTKGLEKILDRIAPEFSERPFGKELVRLFREVYLKAPSIQEGTFALLHNLFGDRGLVVLIPDNPRLKKAMSPIFTDDLINHVPYRLATETTAKLSPHYTVQANPRETNLFYLEDGSRERIDEKGGRFQVHTTRHSFTVPEIAAELEASPEKFSPNVFLRGLFQETILPGVAFIGGGGELAYWMELRTIFENYKVPFPLLVLRNSFLLVDKYWKEKVSRTGVEIPMFFKKTNAVLSEAVKKIAAGKLDIAAEVRVMEECFEKIKGISSGIDPTLAQHVEALKVKLDKKLEGLAKKMLRAEKRKHTELYRAIEKIRAVLFPNDSLQERVDNFIPFFAMAGPSFFQTIYDHSTPLPQGFTILEEE